MLWPFVGGGESFVHAYKKDRYRCKWRDKATLVQKQSCTKALVPPDRPTETRVEPRPKEPQIC